MYIVYPIYVEYLYYRIIVLALIYIKIILYIKKGK